ncbi:MAG: peptide chain release factor N(5)-glutamine methyltransferase [Lentisphaerae bacterium]|nr:peptide chain release factor N(5)-glutamine methyltransferase [Lentisphaerota bacterium]
MAEPRVKTLLDVIQGGTAYLKAHGVESPRLACELLAARLLDCPRLELYLRFAELLGPRHLEAMRRGLQRVGAGEPVQYVIGRVDFMEHTFKVDRRALIPRPETEELVEQVLACEPLWDAERPLLADVGTGCGCIALSLVLARPRAFCLALDVSAGALDLARENADALGAAGRVDFRRGELSGCAEPGSLDGLAANLPYVATPEYETLAPAIREHEPRAALDGGPDGLAVIRSVVRDAAPALKPGGFLFLEIGAGQGDAVRALLDRLGFAELTVMADLAGRDRIVRARRPAR